MRIFARFYFIFIIKPPIEILLKPFYMYLLAFYVAFNFGKDPAEKVFNNWFESFYDLLILALHATDEVYEAMLQIRYVVVSQVLIYYSK